VPEKGLHDLIAAYSSMEDPSFRLVVAGDADHDSEYSRALKSSARNSEVLLTGNVFGVVLGELYSNAGLFVLPSYHEGFPIALLEALSYDLPVLVSDIPPHRDFHLLDKRYFVPGNIAELRFKIAELLPAGINLAELEPYRRMLAEDHDWDVIADSTAAVYREVRGMG
jgi:glycosyltransferase involved in cell wall biosynthesis